MSTIHQTCQKLVQVGFMASNFGMEKAAEELFEKMMKYRPKSDVPLIGMCNAYLMGTQSQKAIDLIDDWKAKGNEVSDILKAYYGVAHHGIGMKSVAEDYFKEVLDNPDSDPVARNIVEKAQGDDD